MDNLAETNSVETAIIPKGTVINGNITIEGRLEMYGVVNGDILSDSRVDVSGDITGNDFYAKDSFITGQIECAQGATVRENTIILGDIKAENLVIDGAIQGKIDVRENITVGEKAIMDSDIKAKTIQVNNGAAINGHCSLCYADTNLGEIFPVTEEIKEAKEPKAPQEPEEDKQLKAAAKPKAVARPKVVKKADAEPVNQQGKSNEA